MLRRRGEDSYKESWIGACRLCFDHGYEAEADIDIHSRDVEGRCSMAKFWRGPDGLVYNGQFSSGERPAWPGGDGADRQSKTARIAAAIWGPDVTAAESWDALQKWAAN